MADQIVPNLEPFHEIFQMATTGKNGKSKIEALKVAVPPGPKSVPADLNFDSYPQGPEALRYAQAGVPGMFDLDHPIMHAINGVHNRAGVQRFNEIGLNSPATNAAALPYVLPQSVTPQMAGYTQILPHELTHYLSEFAARRAHQDSSSFAENRVQELGPYNPMYGYTPENYNDNADERLANRVGRPYADAQFVGQKAAPLLDNANANAIKTSADLLKLLGINLA